MGAADGASGQAIVGSQAVDAVGEFLESMRVEYRTATRVLGPGEVEGQTSGDEGKEGGPGPP